MDPRTWEAPLAVILVALWVIVMLRANGTYWLGRLAINRGEIHPRLEKSLTGEAMNRAHRLSTRFGIFAVPLCFLTVGIQTAVNFSAGFTRMPLALYLPAVTVGCIIWAGFYATIGTVAFSALFSVFT